MELLELKLYEAPNYPVRTFTNENPDIIWKLECQNIHGKSRLTISREDANGSCLFCFVGTSTPDFGSFFDFVFINGEPLVYEIPLIDFDSRHDNSEPVKIECRVYKRIGPRHQMTDCWGTGRDKRPWHFPRYLLERKHWLTGFLLLLANGNDVLRCMVYFKQSGNVYLRMGKFDRPIYFCGKFTCSEVGRLTYFTLLPGATDADVYVCKWNLPIESGSDTRPYLSLNYEMLVSFSIEKIKLLVQYHTLTFFRYDLFLFDRQSAKNVTLIVQDQIFDAHRFVLSARSRKFREILSEHKLHYEIKIEDLDISTVQEMLMFVYWSKVYVTDVDGIMKLYHAAEEYEITEMKRVCTRFLKSRITIENADKILNWADGRNEDIEEAVRYYQNEFN